MAETIELSAGDGTRLDAYLARPQATPKAGLVVVQEVFGVNAHIRRVADGFAAEGYLAVAPALFDRRERGVELDYDEAGLAKGRSLRGAITWDEVALDVAAAVGAAAEAGKVGVVGYCWGGSVAWLAACRLPVAAAVGYYGGQINDLIDEAPGCPVMLHFGEADAMIPLDNVDAIRQRHPAVEVFTYPAGHGFNCDARADFDAESAATARERSLALLARTL